MYFVCKKWISNLLACLLLPIKMEEWVLVKPSEEKKERKDKKNTIGIGSWKEKKKHFKLIKEN